MFSRFICVVSLAVGFVAQPQAALPQQNTQPPPQQTSAQTAEPHNFRIAGIVVDGASGAPLARTQVFVSLNTSRGDRRSVITGEGGRFLFENLARGMYELDAQHKGYATQAFEQHENFWTGIAVGPDLDSENLVFRLRPAASIFGRITDDQNEPVRDAQVMLFESTLSNGKRGMRSRSQTTTNDEGSYRFGHLEPGKYLVAVSAQPWYAQYSFRPQPVTNRALDGSGVVQISQPGRPSSDPALDVSYPTTFYPAATDPASAAPISLRPGDRASADIILVAVPALHVRINTGISDPSRPVMPILLQRLFDGFVPNTRSQSNMAAPGVIEIVGLAPGRYTMQVQTFDAKGQRTLGPLREIDAINDADIQAAETTTSSAITGTIKVEGSERPLRPFFIQLRNTDSGEPLGAQASPTNDFDIGQRVPPGTYEVQVANTPAFFIKSMSATGANVVGRRLTINSADAVHLTIVMSHGVGSVAGTVMRQDKPASGAMVVLIPADPVNNAALFRRNQSDSDGSFTLPSVPPGKYTIVAIQNGWDLEWANPDVLRNYVGGGEAVTVAPDGKYTVTVKVQ